jgi:hypothetical protein
MKPLQALSESNNDQNSKVGWPFAKTPIKYNNHRTPI